jgi:transglutaminase-like putative cysteine protease
VDEYLASSKYIDFKHPLVLGTALSLADGLSERTDVARRCFEFVRDEIKHSWDFKLNPVTCRASDVLLHGTGYCYAKSHLLAALLRANGIPAGLCYQRLSIGDAGPPYCLHGLNAVHFDDFGWYRVDPRGNKAGVSAEFSPPKEVLAYSGREPGERHFARIWAEPLSVVTSTLERYGDIGLVHANLPDYDGAADTGTM